MDAYLRNGMDGDVTSTRASTPARTSPTSPPTGSCRARCSGDDARIRKALTDQLTVFVTIDPYDLQHGVTDGYYADGSFIQHHSVAYTGSYGKGLLTRVVQTVKMLDGTGYAQGDELVAVVQGWVAQRVRAADLRGLDDGDRQGPGGVADRPPGTPTSRSIVEAVVDLSDYATGADAARTQGRT